MKNISFYNLLNFQYLLIPPLGGSRESEYVKRGEVLKISKL